MERDGYKDYRRAPVTFGILVFIKTAEKKLFKNLKTYLAGEQTTLQFFLAPLFLDSLIEEIKHFCYITSGVYPSMD